MVALPSPIAKELLYLYVKKQRKKHMFEEPSHGNQLSLHNVRKIGLKRQQKAWASSSILQQQFSGTAGW
jgi:hypothetical protein